MKKLTSIICFALALISSSAVAQGLVNFFNNQSTLVSSYNGLYVVWHPWPSFFFALLTGPAGTTDPHAFTFSGITGTNQVVPGRFTGGYAVPVPGWLPGTQRAFRVIGWSEDNGATFNPAWIAPGDLSGYAGPPAGWFGVSSIAPSGTAGGGSGPGWFLPLNVFGGSEGIQTGFAMSIVPTDGIPTITLSRSGTQLTLSWPAYPIGFTLEFSDTLAAVSWAPVSGVTGNTVTVDTSVGSRFYRLRR